MNIKSNLTAILLLFKINAFLSQSKIRKAVNKICIFIVSIFIFNTKYRVIAVKAVKQNETVMSIQYNVGLSEPSSAELFH